MDDALSNKDNIANVNTYVSIGSLNIYDFMDYAINGTGGFRDGSFLVPHSREMFYTTRKSICFYQNYIKPIVRAMIEPVFVNDVPRKILSPAGSPDDGSLFNDFLWDCDNTGMYLQTFTENVITLGRLHGITFVVVDNFPIDEQPKTIEQARDGRIFPYVYERTIRQVKKYVLDKFGKLESITFIESQEKNAKGALENRYRYWDANKTVLYKDGTKSNELEAIKTYDHNLGVIPVVTVVATKRTNRYDLNVNPPLYDIARLNHAMFNKDSEIRNLERDQGFSLLYIQGEPSNITVGSSNVIFIPMEASITPGFTSPDPNIQKQLMLYQAEIREAIFRIAEQNGVTGIKSSTSGVAIQWDFYAHESILKKTSSYATTLEEKISEIFKLYTKEDFTYIVDYPQNFQPNDRVNEVKIYDNYLDMDMPPKALAMAKEKITRVLFQGEDEDKLNDVVEEIHRFKEDEQLSNDKDENNEDN